MSDELYCGNGTEPCPGWAQAMLREIRGLREEMAALKRQQDYTADYAQFVESLRRALKPVVSKDCYPSIEHEGGNYGFTVDGLLYDKSSQRTLSRHEAFRLYKMLYEKHKKQPLF